MAEEAKLCSSSVKENEKKKTGNSRTAKETDREEVTWIYTLPFQTSTKTHNANPAVKHDGNDSTTNIKPTSI